jgi:CelD/BcsL family acetyltransferase involved in cellulose biosynthesis
MTQAPGSGIRELDPAMEELLAQREERLPFLHPTWLRTWLAEFGDGFEPVFLECANSQMNAVAPLMREDGRLTFIGDAQICDFMDFLVAPEEPEAAYREIWRQLCGEDWSELDLWGLRDSSPTREALKLLAAGDGYGVLEEMEAVAPRVELPGTWDEYLASLGKKDRHELRRKMRRLLESGAKVDLEVLSERDDIVAAMDLFLELHTRSRQDKTEFMTGQMETFFRRMASAMSGEGLVRLFMLYVDNKPVASVFCFDAGSHLYLYNSGYDPALSNLSVGLVSKALCLRWAIDNGKKGLDFLRGNEPYKYDLGAQDRQIFRLVVRR